MSHADHEWAKEHIPAHLAGGLSAEERARIEAHISGCAECIAEVDAIRRFERGMEDLFAPARAKPGLEERVIRGLRATPGRMAMPVAARVGLALAAVLLLGIVGFVIMGVESGDIPFSSERSAAKRTPAEAPQFQRLGTQSAGEMAQMRVAETLERLGKDTDVVSHGLSDLNELTDDEVFKKAKGEGQNFFMSFDALHKARVREGPAEAESRRRAPVVAKAPAPPPPGIAPPTDFALTTESSARAAGEKYYSYSNDAPTAKKPTSSPGPGAFRPLVAAEAASGHERANKRNEELKEIVDEKRALEPPGQDRGGEVPEEPKPQAQPQRKIIRSGEMEFEIENFDASVDNVTMIAAEEQGFVATVNSEKLPNGKVRGTVVVRCPPDNLDRLLLKLRALGELKSQRIGSQDITKMYTDLESRLRAARTMEERLLQIIKEGKGAIKDLLQAEKELGEWRTKIETFEGEIRYYNSMISLSTLTITLYEKEIRAPHGVVETERVDMGVEVEDVEQAHREALAAVEEAKGRVTKSELKQHGRGQFNALVHFEVAPDAAGPLRDRLKQLGTVARLEVQRDQKTEGGPGRVGEVKVKKNDTQFFVSLYNITNVAPRETVHLNLACADAEKVFKDILARVEKAGGRVVTSNLEQPKREQTRGTIHFEVKAAEAETVLADLKALGEVMRMQTTENPDAQNVTRSKQGFQCQVFALGMVAPRETTTVQLACKDVPAAYQALLGAVRKVEGRVLSANLNEQDRHNVTASLDFEVRRDARAGVDEAMAAAGPVYSRSSSQAQDVENVVDSKTRLQLTLLNLERIPPRETHTLAVEVGEVEPRMAEIGALAAGAKGRTAESHVSRDRSGRTVGRIAVDVPLATASAVSEKVKAMGTVRVVESSRNPQVPDSALATARLDVTLSNEVLVPSDSGPWASIRKGLSVSMVALSWSLTLIIIGVCFLGPLGLAGWGAWKVFRKARPGTAGQ